jgi:hypothetical protein
MVEITPSKPKITLPAWHWPLWVSLALFFLAAAIFISLQIYLSRIQADIVSVNNQIKEEAAKVSADDETVIARLNDSLAAFNGLMANHSYFSQLLGLIGSFTYSKVSFSKFDADKDLLTLQLKGSAQNYTALAKQMVALRENENIENLDVKSITFGTSGLEFELSMILDPKIFIKTQ